MLVHSESDEVSAQDLEWDALTAQERVSHLREEFSEAVRVLEAGDLSPTVVSRAEAALTNLRAEMYATATGRRAHEKLEQRLSSLTEPATDEESP